MSFSSRIGALTPGRRRLLARALERASAAPRGAQRLTAFVVCGDAAAADPAALREHLRGVLPEYMVPERIVPVAGIARTASGKVDRARLAAASLDAGVAAGGDGASAPAAAPGAEEADPLHAAVAAIWGELLGVHAPRGDDDFFELGGHSLLGASLLIRIERELGIGVPLSALFEATRLGDFVDRLRGARAAGGPRFLVRLSGGDAALTPLFCVHAPAREIVEHLHPGRAVYNFAHALDPQDPSDGSVEAVAAKYLEELLQVAPRGPYRLCGFSVGGMIAQEMAQCLAAAGHEVELLALADPPPLLQRGFLHYRLRFLLSRFRRRARLGERLRFLATEPFAMLRRRLSARQAALTHRASEAGGQAPSEQAIAFYNMANYVRIGSQYRMRPYPGASVLFLPKLEEGFRDWVCRQWRLALPGLRAVYEIRGAATHAEMFLPPHVDRLAAILARHVEEDEKGDQSRERARSIIPVHSASSAPEAPSAASDA